MNAKKAILTMFVIGFIGFGILGAAPANAQDTSAKNSFFTTLVDRIAAAFNLDKAKVQEVVNQVENEHRVVRETEMKARQEERLSQLVSEGKISEAQKQAIIKKHEEMRSNFNPESMANMTEEQRHAAMEKHKAELDAWAQSQGIDPQYLMFKVKFHRSFDGARGDVMKTTETVTVTQ